MKVFCYVDVEVVDYCEKIVLYVWVVCCCCYGCVYYQVILWQVVFGVGIDCCLVECGQSFVDVVLVEYCLFESLLYVLFKLVKCFVIDGFFVIESVVDVRVVYVYCGCEVVQRGGVKVFCLEDFIGCVQCVFFFVFLGLFLCFWYLLYFCFCFGFCMMIEFFG